MITNVSVHCSPLTKISFVCLVRIIFFDFNAIKSRYLPLQILLQKKFNKAAIDQKTWKIKNIQDVLVLPLK